MLMAVATMTSGVASATVTKFTVTGTFEDDTSLSGSFLFDDSKSGFDRFQNIDVRSTTSGPVPTTGTFGSFSGFSGPGTLVGFSSSTTFNRVELGFETVTGGDLSQVRTYNLDPFATNYYISATRNRVALLSGAFTTAVQGVPEPATWAMLLIGFGMVAGASRYRRKTAKVSLA